MASMRCMVGGLVLYVPELVFREVARLTARRAAFQPEQVGDLVDAEA